MVYKRIFGTVAGLITAFVAVFLLELLQQSLFNAEKFPETTDQAAIDAYIERLPKDLLVVNAVSYGIAAFLGCYVAILITRRKQTWVHFTLVFFAVTVVNFFSFHHPAWMVALGLFVTLIGGYLPSRLIKSAT